VCVRLRLWLVQEFDIGGRAEFWLSVRRRWPWLEVSVEKEVFAFGALEL
jgi:hypothetical protein